MPIRLKSRGGESRQSGSIASESYTEKNHWYSGSKWPLCFVWISWVYFLAIKARYGFFKLIDHLKWRAPVPVIVVGNITVGGTGNRDAGTHRDPGSAAGHSLGHLSQ